MSPIIDCADIRFLQAHLGKKIGKTGFIALLSLSAILAGGSVSMFFVTHAHIAAGLLSGISLLFFIPAIWYKKQLSVLPPTDNSPGGRLSVDVLIRIPPSTVLSPQSLYDLLSDHWQSYFFSNHLLFSKEQIKSCLSADEKDLKQALDLAFNLADKHHTKTVELGFVIAGLLLSSSEFKDLIVKLQLSSDDLISVADWLGRNLDDTNLKQNKLGGIARDWAFGFTPLLDKLGHNVSLSVRGIGGSFDWLANSDTVKSIESAFENHANAVSLIGPEGIGKTNNVYALAQRMIEGNSSPSLTYHQIINLNATDITSIAHGAGELENIMIRLVNEASHAGHIILFFDDIESFLSSGPGSFDATQILVSIIQARSVPIILAMTPRDYQTIKSQNQSLAGLLTPIVLQELSEADVIRVLEDNAIGMENRYKVLIAYEALRSAYRLSGRYEQDVAYPGKAIKLLEQSLNHANNNVITKESVELAIEQTHGVKVGTAKPAEVDVLLQLEDKIHLRMINQVHAVSVVANSLRRARAGVTNPKRPIGSFLFLGPTGVGKTELAKAISATYFGSEDNLIRLDMSEFQQPDDVQRLLSTGVSENASLLMRVRQQPFAVVLLDEIEKAHPNILNLLLQMLDEGQLTDISGRPASFKDCVIIATSNAGAETIRDRISKGQDLEGFSKEFSDTLIASGQFKPELLNRFDEMVLFRPLKPEELAQVVKLMLTEVNKTLSTQNISIELTPAAIQKIVEKGNDPRLGARPMRRTLQTAVENTIAELILKQEANPGDHIILDDQNLKF